MPNTSLIKDNSILNRFCVVYLYDNRLVVLVYIQGLRVNTKSNVLFNFLGIFIAHLMSNKSTAQRDPFLLSFFESS